jgi:hypothetical protein
VVRGRLAAAGAAFLLLGGFQAPPPERPKAEGAESNIVVTGTRDALVEAYIDELTRTRGEDQIARWNSQICPRAVGLDAAHNAYLSGRVIELAKANGVPVERGACIPNILIVVTQEADRFVDLLLERHPLLFAPHGGRPPSAVAEALRTPRAVRWVQASAWGNADGRPLDGKNNFIYSASRLQASTRQNAVLSIVVVDATRIEHVTWRAFSAYLAMVAMALPPPDLKPLEGGTILSLFGTERPQAPADLTRWDRAYLKVLYKSDPAAPANMQRHALVQTVKQELKKE